ncbi:MAG: rRNA maturation RNase YbeY [Chloroflexota bacterium]
MITVEIDQQFKQAISPEVLSDLVKAVFAHLQLPDSPGLSIKISDDTAIQELNRSYLGIDAPTDVLSFPLPFEDPESGSQYYGDMIVSYPTAAAQAQSGGHPIEDEIKLLVVHGLLHLLGYNHASEADKKEMWARQSELLIALKIKAQPTE